MIRFPAAHYRAKATIKACAESGAGIEYLPDAPRFRYFPPAEKPLHYGPPSRRGDFRPSCRPGCACKKQRFSPAALSLAPMYGVRLTDTSAAEHAAKESWKNGNPEPLRKWLAARAALSFENERFAA